MTLARVAGGIAAWLPLIPSPRDLHDGICAGGRQQRRSLPRPRGSALNSDAFGAHAGGCQARRTRLSGWGDITIRRRLLPSGFMT
jgi:hypothetical protein